MKNHQNKVKLNKFHQIKKKKTSSNPKKTVRDLQRLLSNVSKSKSQID